MFDSHAPRFKKSPLPLDVVPCSDTEDSVWQALSLSEGFPGTSAGKEPACNAGDPSSIPGSTRSPGEERGYPLQYSWASFMAQTVNNPPAMWDTGFDPWAGKIPWRRAWQPTPVFLPGESLWMEEPGGLQSIGLQRVRYK